MTHVRTVKGWLSDSSMPEILHKQLSPKRSFSEVAHVFAKASRSAPLTDHLIPNEPPCYDQGDWGSCVLNAVCGALNIVLAVEGNQAAPLSRMWLYWHCRDMMGTDGEDSGTYPHLAVDRVSKIGVPSEAMWPYTDENMYKAPTPDTYPEASDNKATAWFAITADGKDRLTQMETAIRSNHPVVYASPVGAELQNYILGQVLTIPDPNTLDGGHSTCFVGVSYVAGKRLWHVRNSWGTDWGDNGHFLMDDAWASWAALTDLQVLTRMDPLLF